jgi:hypothetical protein
LPVATVNTGTGLALTRKYVIDTAQAHGWPLMELHPPRSYEMSPIRQMCANVRCPGDVPAQVGPALCPACTRRWHELAHVWRDAQPEADNQLDRTTPSKAQQRASEASSDLRRPAP